MKTTITLLTAQLLTSLAALHASDASEQMGNGSTSDSKWSLYLERPNAEPLLVNNFVFGSAKEVQFTNEIDGFTVKFVAKNMNGYWSYHAEASSTREGAKCYLSLAKQYETRQTPFSFFGQVTKSGIYRQSPHEPGDYYFLDKCLMQAVPMVALKDESGFEFAICDTPAMYDNYTSQTYDLQNRKVKLSSGDNGCVFRNDGFLPDTETADKAERQAKKLFRIEPYYFAADANTVHQMNGLYMRTPGADIGKLRESINLAISRHWSNGKVVDLLGATVFSTTYMNLRVNETGDSKYWVVPAIGYSNKQYTRDAFYMSMVLPPKYSKYCYENEEKKEHVFTGAERHLCTLIWAYRNYLAGHSVNLGRLKNILDRVEEHVSDGYYHGYMEGTRKDGCWQGMNDLMAYEKDDTLTHNQGLFVAALMCASKMGIEPKTSITLAQHHYQNLFNAEIGGFPASRQKNTILDVTALMGDLFAQVYLGKPLLERAQVLAHYETMKKHAKTPFGFKCFCNPDGSYLKIEQYDSKSFKSAVNPNAHDGTDGAYQCGGSWYMFDMLMLMDAYLHGAKDAEDLMIWRTKYEFEIGHTTHECINTKTGKPTQPNMGWNAAVYGIWSEIMQQGKASDRFFKSIDALRNSK